MTRATSIPSLASSLTLLLMAGPLHAAPGAASPSATSPSAAGSSAKPSTSDESKRPAGRPAQEPRRAGLRGASRRATYKLAEPSPELKQRATRLRRSGAGMRYAGVTISGLGLASTLAGVYLLARTGGPSFQTAGVVTLISGLVLLAGGATIWAVGQRRANKADLLILEAQLRQASLLPGPSPRRRLHYPPLPTPHLLLSARLRF